MHLDGYSNLTKFATGGMATVYKARQISLNRIVAVKLLSAEFLWDREAQDLFDQESLVIAQLTHPNIIHIIDRGLTEKGRPYFVMEYIQGSELSEIIHKEKLSLNSKINLLMQICKGMSAAHKNGVIHRDIKPSNFLLDADGHLYILDFGIAWLAANGKPENIVGTPDYMSPEQFTHPERVSHLSDIYSLGIIMYEMFMGQLPPGNNKQRSAKLENLPPDLSALIEKCLKTQPHERPSSADEIRLQLLKFTQGAHLNQQQKSEANTALNNTNNKFSLLDLIKKTKYGAVYLFEDRNRHSLMVIKKCSRSFAGYQEAKLLSKLSHPNIITIYGTSKNLNAFIIVMQHLAGGSLQDRLVRKFTLKQFLPIAKAICEAMIFAHNNDITHKNLRPSNILYDNSGNIKLSDFGLEEHYVNDSDSNDWYQPKDRGCSSKTRDMYSTGAIFYRMLTGKQVDFLNKRIKSEDAFSSLNAEIQKVLKDMMEEDSNNHYQSFDQLLPDLKKLGQAARKKSQKKLNRLSRLLFIVFMLSVLAGFIAGLYFYFNPSEQQMLMEFLRSNLP